MRCCPRLPGAVCELTRPARFQALQVQRCGGDRHLEIARDFGEAGDPVNQMLQNTQPRPRSQRLGNGDAMRLRNQFVPDHQRPILIVFLSSNRCMFRPFKACPLIHFSHRNTWSNASSIRNMGSNISKVAKLLHIPLILAPPLRCFGEGAGGRGRPCDKRDSQRCPLLSPLWERGPGGEG